MTKSFFQDVEKAYRILSDDDKRRHYDKTGEVKGSSDPIESKLTELFAAFIDKEDYQGDLIKKIKSLVKENMRRISHQIDQIKKKLDKHQSIKGRIVKTEGENIFAMVLSAKITHMKTNIEGLEKIQGDIYKVLERLDDYEDVNPTPENPRYTSYGILGGSTY